MIDDSGLPSSDMNNSMSFFMSGLLAERAVLLEFPRSDLSICIVDDNARPEQSTSRGTELMHERQTQSCRDFRWDEGSHFEENRPGETALPPAALNSGTISGASPSKSQSHHRPTLKRSGGSASDFRKNTDGNVRFQTGTMRRRTLRRSANSDTMLLKMPVRTDSPKVCRGLIRKNADWGDGNRPSTNASLLATGLPKVPRRTEICNRSDDCTTETALMGDDSLTQSSLSAASRLSGMSDVSHSGESLRRSSSSSRSMASNFRMGSDKSDRKTVTKSENRSSGAILANKGKRSSSLESTLKERASLLGLDLN